jgi:glucuronate isomerase
MRGFPGEDFLLESRPARRLYREHAEGRPIFDYHCHLPAADIALNHRFADISEAWLAGDHYKWRALRANGVAESLVSGGAPAREKFLAWAACVPTTVGNPLYHWTHLELKRIFGVTELLGPRSAERIYDRCSALLARDEYRVRPLLVRMNVSVVCTTDDPVDSLEHHRALRADTGFPVTVVPTFRPDAARGVENPPAFNAWVESLAETSGIAISGWDDLLEALRLRHIFFHENGCRVSDHGIEEPYAEECSLADARRVFSAVRAGSAPSAADARAFKSAVMLELARLDARAGWVQQLHLGALRDVNTRFLRQCGLNSGFDTIGDFSLARPLARFLDRLDSEGSLPRTVLYSLNPADTALLAAMAGSFPEEGVRGKVQVGPAWWFNDQRHGIEEQLRTLADIGLLPRFIGMLTDSRSFLSWPRHEYFRRILCNMLGTAVQHGELPDDDALLGGIVEDICWNNAREYFQLPLKGFDGEAARGGP